MNSTLSGKNIVVIGTQPSLNDNTGLIRLNLDAETNWINVSGIETGALSSDNAGDVVISPDSLMGWTVHGLEGVAKHVRDRVSRQIPVVVLVLSSTGPTLTRGHEESIIGVSSIKELPEALRQAMGL